MPTLKNAPDVKAPYSRPAASISFTCIQVWEGLRWLDPFDPDQAANLVLKMSELHCSFPETRECSADSVLQYLKRLLEAVCATSVPPSLGDESDFMDGGNQDVAQQIEEKINTASDNGKASASMHSSISDVSANDLSSPSKVSSCRPFGFSVEPFRRKPRIEKVITCVCMFV